MECAARSLQEKRVLMAAHQSGISSALGLTSKSFLSCLNLACDQRMFHFVVQKTGTVAASKTLSAAAAVLFNARPAASANRSMGSLCPREREKGQSVNRRTERSTKWTTGGGDRGGRGGRGRWPPLLPESMYVQIGVSPFSPRLRRSCHQLGGREKGKRIAALLRNR